MPFDDDIRLGFGKCLGEANHESAESLIVRVSNDHLVALLVRLVGAKVCIAMECHEQPIHLHIPLLLPRRLGHPEERSQNVHFRGE